MGTFGTGPFDNDDALDLIDALKNQPAHQRREVLERLFFRVQDRSDLLEWKFSAKQIVGATAVVAASLPGGEGIRQELANMGYDVTEILIPAQDGELSADAYEAFLVAAGKDGSWHEGWVSPDDAAQARRTADQLAAIFFREQHVHEQELPLEF